MKRILLSTIAITSAFSLEFIPLGYKAIGMGGAGVANATGSASAYYNPALLANHRYNVEVAASAGVGIREINLIERIDKLANDYKLSDTIKHIANNAPISGSNTASGDNIKMKKALKEIYHLSQGNGFELKPTAAFSIQVGNFALGVYGYANLSANAHIDREHLYLIFEDKDKGGYYYYYPDTDTYGATDKDTYEKYSLEYALDNNLTYLNVRGIAVAEVPISYAFKYDYLGTDLSFGINLKYIEGITYKNILALDTDSDALEDSLNDNKKVSSTFGVDVGMLISKEGFRAGIVGKNLNSPKIDFYDGTKYTLKPQVRSGIAIDFTSFLTAAIDIDLTQNDTAIPGYKSQYVGGGINLHQSWFSIRAGAMKNMLEEDEGVILTAGLGLGLKWFQLDVAAEASTKKGTYDGNEIPRYAKINLALISRWGGK